MPGRSWDNDASYRWRILAILPAVVLLFAVAVFVTRHMAPQDVFKYVGWRGELELMPEITIIPDAPSPDVTPTETGKTPERTVVLDLADAPGEFEPNPPRVEREPDKVTAPAFDDLENAPSVREPDNKPVPYSNDAIILKQVKPVYPPEMRERGIEGKVTIEVLVNEAGRVTEARVVSRLGPEAFEEAALTAIRQWEYQSPLDDRGRPMQFWARYRVNFTLPQ